MGVDHTDGGSDASIEAVEEEPAADRRPPPPPDRPGTDGYPSRADSRNGAAAANEGTPTTDEVREEEPDTEESGDAGGREQRLDGRAAPHDSTATAGTDEPGSELSVEGEPSSEGAEAAWITGGPDIGGDLPTGAELVKMEDDKQSRAERARRKIYESGDEVLDDVGKVVNRVDQIFERPPTGHPETRTGPEVIPAPHEGVSAGDAATALIAAGVVLGEIFRRGRETLRQRKGV
ncbi:hypothetical protein [Actinoallomurus acaciae]|uniref:Uncharacterized protein n=1 Tax=Actinoallomurus acaciae TaxID=502577 RepID=A0ABV5YIT3_9ACTN